MSGGMIGLACGEQGRFSDVIPAIISLEKPPGTLFMKATSLGPAAGFNLIAQEVLNRKLDWLFLINDDNLWPTDIIPKFLRYNVDVVGGFYLTRTMPFNPVAFDRLLEPEELPAGTDPKDRWYHRYFPKTGDSGLQRIIATGDGGLLIRRHVLEGIKYPWWEYGETHGDCCDHDMVFSRKVREANCEMYLDLDTPVQHIITASMAPMRTDEGEWNVKITQANGQRSIQLPFASQVKYNG